MAGGQEGEGIGLTRRTGWLGVLVGVLVTASGLLPWWIAGDLAEAVADGRAYLQLAGFASLVVPALAAGALLGRQMPSGREVFRLAGGAFVSASIVGSLIVWYSYADLGTLRRLVLALSGGTALTGFWIWVGLLVGGAVMLGRPPDEGRAET